MSNRNDHEGLPVWSQVQQTSELHPGHPGQENEFQLGYAQERQQQQAPHKRSRRGALLLMVLALGLGAGFALALAVVPQVVGTSLTSTVETDVAAPSDSESEQSVTNSVAEGEMEMEADGDTNTDTRVAALPTADPASDLAEILDPSNLPTGETGDQMAIQIETLSPDERGGATATVRQDGRVHFEGAFRSQSEADRYVARAEEIFGDGAILETYTIDPDAPPPAANNVALDKPVLFETGSATIHPEYVPFLEACGNILKLNPSITMSISAYTDTVGDEEFNLALSQQRAQAIVDFYLDFEVDGRQLLGSGFGEESAFGEGGSDEGKAQNRRAMLQLLDVMGE